MKLSIITIKVNGHDVKVTTDQEVTQAYITSIVEHIRTIERETDSRVNKLVDKREAKNV